MAIPGCGGGKPPVTVVPNPIAVVGLPTPSAPGPVNTYNGGQSPGQWSLTLNNTSGAFSYQPVTYPAAATTGNLQTGGGFSSLGAAGLAYEVLGRAAVLRPGGSASSPIFSVPQTSCYAITGKMRFQYIAMFPGTQTNLIAQGSLDPLAYGSIVASTDSTGANWQFENLQGNTVSGPASFTGSCASANSAAAIALSGQTLLSDYWAPVPNTVTALPSTAKSNIWIGPSGFFAADQSDPAQTNPTGASLAGMAEPTASLSTSALASAQYLGFVYQAPTSASTGYTAVPAFTAPVGFGQVVAGSGSSLTGGIFPSDNLAGAPNSDTVITLGSESSTLNGLYASVLITVLDPQQNCANFPGQPSGFTPKNVTSGVNAQGYITCTFPGVAIAGNPDGNYAIFVNTYNWAATLGGAPQEFFLFQQQ